MMTQEAVLHSILLPHAAVHVELMEDIGVQANYLAIPSGKQLITYHNPASATLHVSSFRLTVWGGGVWGDSARGGRRQVSEARIST